MLPPVQIASRSTLAFAESASEAAPSHVVSGSAVQDQASQADDGNSTTASAVAGRINNLLLSSRSTVRADMATIADMVGSAININRLPGESDGAFAARFVTALAKLTDSQRTALQTQLNQVLKGLQVQVLLQVLQNQDGPEAALLSAYMEIQRSNSDNLKAQTVVASYSQNAKTAPDETSGQASLNTAPSTTAAATQAAVTPQSSITIALQASIAGAKDKEEMIAKLAAALRQASAGSIPEEATQPEFSASAAQLISADDESSQKLAPRSSAEGSIGTSNGAGSGMATGKSTSADLSAAINSAKPAQNAPAASQTVPAAPQTQAQAQQAVPQTAKQAVTLPPSPSSAVMAGVQQNGPALTADQSAAPVQAGKTVSEQHLQTAAAVVTSPLASQPQAVPTDEDAMDSATIVATALASGGLINAAILAPQSQTTAQNAPDSTLLRQMFFQNSETPEAAEVAALRALANRPETAQNADTESNTKTALGTEDQPDQQGAEKAATRSQTALTLAAVQTVATPPIPPHITPPLGVPLLVGNYLAMQDPPNTGNGDINVDAIDPLSDEEPRRDGRRQNPEQDSAESEDNADEADAEENGLSAIGDTVEDDQEALLNGAEISVPADGFAALPSPQDEPVRADMLYWKIADLA